MKQRIKELANKTTNEIADQFTRGIGNNANITEIVEKFAELIVRECIDCCNEVAADADAMKNSKFVTDAGRMLHEGMWGGATNSAITINKHFGVE